MKWVWLVLGTVILAAIIVLWQDSAGWRGAPGSRPVASMPASPAASGGEPVRPSRAPKTPSAQGAGTDAPRGAADATTPGAAAVGPPGSAAAAGTNGAPPATERPLPKIDGVEVARGSIETLPDGTIVADKRFRITGAGTAADPYRVSWECLQSAQDTYVPRLGETKLPERVAMLNGKVVRMEGYLAFPLLGQESKEIILMLNQWDGCCIGVPPTPYDSIEVKLAEPIRNTRRHASFTFGAITGRFKVEPFLVENWLAGLYLLEDAAFEPEEF